MRSSLSHWLLVLASLCIAGQVTELSAAESDTLVVRVVLQHRGTLIVEVSRSIGGPIGDLGFRLDSAINARFWKTPYPLPDTATVALFEIRPINKALDASCTLRLSSRDRLTLVPYSYKPASMDFDVGSELDFGTVNPGEKTERTVRISNTGTENLGIDSIRFSLSPARLSLANPDVLGDTLNIDGDAIELRIAAEPTEPYATYYDTLRIVSCCDEFHLPIVIRTGGITAAPGEEAVPTLALLAANPVSGSAEFVLSVPAATRARLTLVDVAGRQLAVVMDEPMPAGNRHVRLDLANVPAGVYFATFSTGVQQVSTTVVVLR